jgi:hypothetical protein
MAQRMGRMLATGAVALAAIGVAVAGQGPATAATTSQWRVTYHDTDTSGGSFYGVAAISKTDAWAVGDRYDSQGGGVYRPFIWHWDGTAWSEASVPFTDVSTSVVAASSAANVWVVGQQKYTAVTQVYRFDGQSWQSIPVPSQTSFDSLAVLSPTDVWALGSAATSSSDLFHWNGTRWAGYTEATAPELSSLDASGPDNVWAVGDRQALGATKGTLLAYRWDGSRWARATVPHLVVSTEPGVAAVSPTDVWIGGMLPSTRGFYLYWNGQTWQEGVAPRTIAAADDVVPDGTGGVWLGSWAHWNGHEWLNTADISGVTAMGIQQMVAIPGTSSYWGGGAVIESQTGTVYKPAIMVYGARP